LVPPPLPARVSAPTLPTTPSREVAPAPKVQAPPVTVRGATPPPLPANEVELLADADVLDADADADVDVKPMTYSQPELKVVPRPRRLVLLSAVLIAVGSAGWLGVRGVGNHEGRDAGAHSAAAAAQLESASTIPPQLDGEAEDSANASDPSALAAKSASKKTPASHPSKGAASRPKTSAKRAPAHAANSKKKASAQGSTKPRRASH